MPTFNATKFNLCDALNWSCYTFENSAKTLSKSQYQQHNGPQKNSILSPTQSIATCAVAHRLQLRSAVEAYIGGHLINTNKTYL